MFYALLMYLTRDKVAREQKQHIHEERIAEIQKKTASDVKERISRHRSGNSNAKPTARKCQWENMDSNH